MSQYIYAIINEYNNKFYIGRTKCLSKRFNDHFNHLKNQSHINNHLQNAWNKYHQYFRFMILHKIDYANDDIDLKIAQQIEQAYIDEFIDKDMIYNISHSSITPIICGEDHHFYGKSNKEWMTKDQYEKMINQMKENFKGRNNPFYGRQHSQDTINKISQSRKKQIANGSYKIHNCKKLKAYNKTYESINKAHKDLNISRYWIEKYCADETNNDFQLL